MIYKTGKPQWNFLNGGGEMGEVMRGRNWEHTSLGIPETWPQSLKFAVITLLHNSFPTFIFWGDEYVCFYNDAYRPSLGNEGKHPFILGQKGAEAWPEIWESIHPLLNSVRTTGKPTWSENQLIPFFRNGRIENMYWTFSYSPLIDEYGNIAGVLAMCMETTKEVDTLEKLKESQDELAFAIESAELGTWDLDPIENRLKTNHRLKTWFGLPEVEEMSLEQATHAIIERDRKRVDAAIQKAINPVTGGKYDISYTIQNRETGQERYVRAVGRAWINEQNICYRFNGTLQDNTEQRQAEKERLNLISMMEASHEFIGFSNADYTIEYANPSALKMLGWESSDGQNILEGIYSKDIAKVKDSLPKVLKDGYYTDEIRIWNQKTKKATWLQWNVIPVLDEDTDQVTGFGTVSSNIDKRKAKELELRQAFENVQEEKENFRNLIKRAPVGIAVFFGENHVFEMVNEIAASFMDKNTIEIIGKSIFEIIPSGNNILRSVFDEVLETGKIVRKLELPVAVQHHGKIETGFFNLVLQPLKDLKEKTVGIMVIADEVSDSVRLKHILRENERQFRKLIMQSPIPMAIFRGEDLRIELANAVMLDKIWRRSESEVIGNRLIEVFPELKKQKYPRILQKVLQTGKPTSEKESLAIVESDSGVHEFYVDYDYEPLKEKDGRTTGIMITVSDVTDRVLARKKLEEFSKEMEKEVHKRTQMLASANEQLATSIKQLEAINTDLESFAYVSSHDLQEPLRKIQMFTSRIADSDADNLSDRGKQDFEKITLAAKRMRGLIEDLLAFSRANTDSSEFEQNDLTSILEEVCENLEDRIQETGARIEADHLPILKVIPFQIRQVFHNLIENGIKFSEVGEAPFISISSETIKVEKDNILKLDSGKVYAKIEITDNGIGFEPQFAEKIFDVFQRLHGKQEYEGTGIGLAIVKKIMQNHNGAITASSEKGKGATFHLYLPMG